MATTQNYFPQKSESAPMIYAYEDKYDPQLKGILKVGYTTIGVQERVRQQYNIVRPGEPPYRILVEESAMNQRNRIPVIQCRSIDDQVRTIASLFSRSFFVIDFRFSFTFSKSVF
jgi:hypothetical protein